MVKILHTADVHIKEEEDKRWRALETFLNTADQRDIEYAVISGDLFHKETIADFTVQNIRPLFEDRAFTTYIIPGNHDADAYSEGDYLGDTVELLTATPYQIIENETTRFIGIPYQKISSQKLLEIIVEIDENIDSKKTNIVLLHGDLASSGTSEEATGSGEAGQYMPARLAYFENTEIDYVLAGHYHTNFITKQYGDDNYLVYPGSPVSTTKKETGQRHADLVSTGDTPEAVKLDTFYYERVSVQLDTDSDPAPKIQKKLEEEDEDATIVLQVEGFISTSEMELRDELGRFEDEYDIASIDHDYREISHVTDTPLYETFTSKLYDRDVSEEKLETAERYFLQAASEAMRE